MGGRDEVRVVCSDLDKVLSMTRHKDITWQV